MVNSMSRLGYRALTSAEPMITSVSVCSFVREISASISSVLIHMLITRSIRGKSFTIQQYTAYNFAYARIKDLTKTGVLIFEIKA